MERQWSVRMYREGDEEGTRELWNAVYPEHQYDREQWLDWCKWMYSDNPAGDGWIWLVEHNNKIVGQHGRIPIKMKVGTETITTSYTVRAMTHPDYRRLGMLETLIKAVHAEMDKKGVNVGYRFPNPFSRRIGLRELNWFDVSWLQSSSKSLNWANVIKWKFLNRFLQRVLSIGASL